MKTYCVNLSDKNLGWREENKAIFIIQASNKMQAQIIIDELFEDIKFGDVKEIDGSLFNFESER